MHIQTGSVLGNGCKIGAQVEITNCVLMDGVVIQDNVVLKHSVLAPGVVVGKNSKLNTCAVGENYSVPQGTNLESEALSTQDFVL